jgi:hypothetical protein
MKYFGRWFSLSDDRGPFIARGRVEARTHRTDHAVSFTRRGRERGPRIDRSAWTDGRPLQPQQCVRVEYKRWKTHFMSAPRVEKAVDNESGDVRLNSVVVPSTICSVVSAVHAMENVQMT